MWNFTPPNTFSHKRPAFWAVAAAVTACVFLTACLPADTEKQGGDIAAASNEAEEWLDYWGDVHMPWNGSAETTRPEFPGVSFRWTPEKLEAETNGESMVLYTGMPVWSVFFSDISGDGLPELCSALSTGSGVIDQRIAVYDYANNKGYELAERMRYDYGLYIKDGKLMAEKREYNGGVVQSGRLMLEDGALRIEGGPAHAAQGDYASEACLYMNPLSSFAAFGGDSGQLYHIGENEFSIINKSDGKIAATVSKVEWGWQEFPYSEEEWEKLYVPGGGVVNISGAYREKLYQPLTEQYSLLMMDGQLWLAEIHENPQMGRFLWSVYSLKPQSRISGDTEALALEAGADEEIDRLLETIMSSPAASSAPGDYIAAHPGEYESLLQYGDDMLRYIFAEFLKGGQTGLKGHIMRSLMDELAGSEALALQSENGQAYFDAWLAEARRTKQQNGGAYMKENAPKAWLALSMAKETE